MKDERSSPARLRRGIILASGRGVSMCCRGLRNCRFRRLASEGWSGRNIRHKARRGGGRASNVARKGRRAFGLSWFRRRRREGRADDREGAIVRFESFAASASGHGRAGFPDGKPVHVRMGRGGDAIGRNTVVNDRVVITRKSRVRDRFIIDARNLIARQCKWAQTVMAEVTQRDKRIAIGCEAEIKVGCHRVAIESETKAGPIRGSRRQGRPAAIII